MKINATHCTRYLESGRYITDALGRNEIAIWLYRVFSRAEQAKS